MKTITSVVLALLSLTNINPTLASSVTNHALCEINDCKKYVRQIKQLANNKSGEAQLLLASFYLNGVGVDKKPNKAISYYKKAHKAGLGQASWVLSKLYKDGQYVEKDPSYSKELYDIAVAKNVSAALFDKATKLIDFKSTNNVEAISLLHKASLQNHNPSSYLLAKMHEFGEGVQQDLLVAANLYKSLEHYDYRDSTQRFDAVLNSSKALPAVYSEIEKLDVETFVVKGDKLDLNSSLGILTAKLNSSGMYDRRGGFSHIRGKNCANSSSSCGQVTDKGRFMKGKD